MNYFNKALSLIAISISCISGSFAMDCSQNYNGCVGENNPQINTSTKFKYSKNALYTFFCEDKSLLKKLNEIIRSTITAEYDPDYENKKMDEIFDLESFVTNLEQMRPNGTVTLLFNQNISQNARKELGQYMLYYLYTHHPSFQETGFRIDYISKNRDSSILGIILKQHLDELNMSTNDLLSPKYKQY